MTVSYAAKVSKASQAGAFFRLLCIWKGSLYKLVWLDYLLWITTYFVFSCIYRFALDAQQRIGFENWCKFCDKYIDLIPLAWVLAFFVTLIVNRWWSQWSSLPWPDSTAIKINYIVAGDDDQSRLIRRSVIRYANLCIVLLLRIVSSKIRKRFPTFQHIVEAGLMTENEMLALQEAEAKSDYGVYWVPISWATTITEQAWRHGFILESRFLEEINNELISVKNKCGEIYCYDYVNVPLVYVQVVTMGVYCYLIVSLFARQYLCGGHGGHADYTHDDVDYVFPIFSSIQLIFFLGWLKVAESLVNPFGEDDDDFDLNMLIDRGYQLSFNLVDDVGRFPPEMEQDKFWHVSVPSELPYTIASLPFRSQCPVGSGEVEVPLEEQHQVYDLQLEDKLPVKQSQSNGGFTMDEKLSLKPMPSLMSSIRASVYRARKQSTISTNITTALPTPVIGAARQRKISTESGITGVGRVRKVTITSVAPGETPSQERRENIAIAIETPKMARRMTTKNKFKREPSLIPGPFDLSPVKEAISHQPSQEDKTQKNKPDDDNNNEKKD